MKTTAIVNVYNRPAMLVACLRSLALGTRRVDEVVVSDDGSSDDNVRRMQAVFPDLPFPVRFARQADRGFRVSAARNNGLRQATGDYIISLDCDILLLPDAVMAHVKAARRGWFLAANRAYVGALETEAALQQAMHPRLLEVLWEDADRRHLRQAHRQFQRNAWLRRLGLAKRHKPKILGCHFSIFREDIERVNGFDEAYVGWGLEDDDFSMRLHMAGVRGRSLILEADALHLWHPFVASRVAESAASRNLAYFRRRDIPAYCVHGLRPSPAAACEEGCRMPDRTTDDG